MARTVEQMPGAGGRSTLELVGAITHDTRELIRKEVELAKQEIVEGVASRIKSVAIFGAAGLMGLFALTFVALAGADALASRMPLWVARLNVAAAFAVLAIGALLFAMMMKQRSIVPEETKRTVKEDVEWARQQLKR